MPLSCTCFDMDFDDEGPFWWKPEDYSTMPVFPCRRKCNSCGKQIEPESIVIEFIRTRPPRSDIEYRIYGEGDPEAIQLASKYFCETCADLWWTFDDLGYCVTPWDNMFSILKEYQQMVSNVPAPRQT